MHATRSAAPPSPNHPPPPGAPAPCSQPPTPTAGRAAHCRPAARSDSKPQPKAGRCPPLLRVWRRAAASGAGGCGCPAWPLWPLWWGVHVRHPMRTLPVGLTPAARGWQQPLSRTVPCAVAGGGWVLGAAWYAPHGAAWVAWPGSRRVWVARGGRVPVELAAPLRVPRRRRRLLQPYTVPGEWAGPPPGSRRNSRTPGCTPCILARGWWTRSLHTPAFVVQPAACSLQRAACSVQRAVCSVQCAACSVQCAACSVQCAVCSVQRAACSEPIKSWGSGSRCTRSNFSLRIAMCASPTCVCAP